MQKDKTVVWIRNSHGVVSAKEKWLAQELLRSHPTWEYCDPEFVPSEKVFPLAGGMLTEEGKKRRESANDKSGYVESGERKKDYSMPELHGMAKTKGVKSFGKSKEAIMDELGLT